MKQLRLSLAILACLFHQVLSAQSLSEFRQLLNEARLAFDSSQFEKASEKAISIFEKTAAAIDFDAAELHAEAAMLAGNSLLNWNKPAAAIPFFQALTTAELLPTADSTLIEKGKNRQADAFFQLGWANVIQGFFLEAMLKTEEALRLRLLIFGENHLLVARCFNQLGICRGNLGDLDGSIACFERVIKIAALTEGPDNSRVIRGHVNIGASLVEKGEYRQALAHFETAQTICRRKYGLQNHDDRALVCCNLGYYYSILGDFEKSVDYFQQALNIRLAIMQPEDSDIAYSYSDLGLPYQAKGDYARAVEFHQKALDHRLQVLGPSHPHVAMSLVHLGSCHSQMGELDKAIEELQKALDIHLKFFGKTHSDVAVCLNRLGSCFSKKGDFEQAIHYFGEALAIQQANFGGEHPNVAASLNDLGACFSKKGAPKKAFASYQNALRANRFSAGEPQKAMDPKFLLESLGSIAELQRDTPTRAHETLAEAVAVVDFQRQNLVNIGSKEQLAEKARPVYEARIESAHRLWLTTGEAEYLGEAFDAAENSSALGLLEAIRESRALHFAGLPDSLLNHEFDLRTGISFYEKRRFQLEFEQKKASKAGEMQDVDAHLFELRSQYEAFKKKLAEDFPDYFRLKFQQSATTFADVQPLLAADQTLLKYFVGDSSIFLFLIKPAFAEMIEIRKDFSPIEWVERLRNGIYGFHTAAVKSDLLYEKTVRECAEAARFLHEKLLGPVAGKLTARVIIIPDGELGYVPFEVLLPSAPRDAGNFKTWLFFVRNHAVSYCQSATLLREMEQKIHSTPTTGQLLAFAPWYSGDTSLLALHFADDLSMRKDLQPLKYSGEEVYAAQKLLGGDLFLGGDATEEKFVELAGRYRILHLATHGKADDKAGDYAFLAFSEIKDSLENELLFVRDLYNLSLNADLVVLSACETGIGKLRRGEGIISLARAFAYAGAKSIVTSLWSVSDARTKDLMIYFYKNLKDGQPKDVALAGAKRKFLEKNPGQASHPFFWAGFVGIGDMRRLDK